MRLLTPVLTLLSVACLVGDVNHGHAAWAAFDGFAGGMCLVATVYQWLIHRWATR